jgi:hypothetical protein
MKNLMAILSMVLTLVMLPAIAADAQKTSGAGSEQKSQNKPEKKSPGTMEKAGDSVKSGWNRFTKSVKQGRAKPACTPEKKSLKQCD